MPDNEETVKDDEKISTEKEVVVEDEAGFDVVSKEPEEPAEKPKEEKEEQPAVGDSIVNEIATSWGWKPKDEFYGNPDRWVDAKTFIENERLISTTRHDKGKKLELDIRDLTKMMKNMKSHQEKVRKADIDNLTEKLTEKKNQLIAEGDVEGVGKIDEQLGKVSDMANEEADDSDDETPKLSPLYTEWVEKNDWYGKDVQLSNLADKIAEDYKELPLDKMLKLVDKEIARETDKRKINKESLKTKDAPGKDVATVAGGAHNTKIKKKYTFSDLSFEQKKICENYENIGLYKRQEFVDELGKIGELS